MNSTIIECERLTKEFKYLEPSTNSSASGMWMHYLAGIVKNRAKDPFSRKNGRLRAVNQVNLDVQRGELFGLLGPNGAGKTTLVKMLATVLLPTAGRATVNGYDVVTQSTAVRRSIGVIASGGWLGFDLQLSIRWNLKYWAVLYGCDPRQADEKVDEVLQVVNLSEKSRENSAVLSSGMRQRLAIAKGFLASAAVFFMDEPTVALDPKTANHIREFIKQIRHESNSTIVLTTHNMQEAEELCDRIAILDGGRIIACGTPDSLKKKSRHMVTRLEASGLTPGIVQELREKFPIQHSKYSSPAGRTYGWCHFHLKGPARPYSEIKTFLESHQVQVAVLEQVEPTLEDIYLELTGKEITTHAYAG